MNRAQSASAKGLTIDPPTEAEEEAVRERDHFVVKSTKNSKRLHINAPESTEDYPTPMCHNVTRRLRHRTKDPSVYPIGFRPLCLDCLHLWRDDNGE